MSQSELCSDWSHWADVSSVKNDFAIAYEDMQSASDVVVEVNDCTLLNLDPMSENSPRITTTRVSVALAGGMVCSVGLAASVIATYFYTRTSQE